MLIERWRQRAHLYVGPGGHDEERKVTWLELFYDLIYVAAFVQLGNVLSERVSWAGAALFVGLFVPVWWSWSTMTFFVNRFAIDDIVHRALVVLQMLGVGVLAVMAPDATGASWTIFALAYVAVRILLIALYVRVGSQLEEARPLVRIYVVGFSAGALVWAVGAFAPPPWRWVLWGLGLVVDFLAPHNRRALALYERLPLHLEHLVERYALLTIIVCGESFLKVVGSTEAATSTAATLGLGAAGMAILAALWWTYFDELPLSRVRERTSAVFAWVYGHLPLALATIATAVGVKKLVHGPGSSKYAFLLCVPLAVFLVSAALLEHSTERSDERLHGPRRILTRLGGACAVLAVAFARPVLSAGVFACLVAAACLAVPVADVLVGVRRSTGRAGPAG